MLMFGFCSSYPAAGCLRPHLNHSLWVRLDFTPFLRWASSRELLPHLTAEVQTGLTISKWIQTGQSTVHIFVLWIFWCRFWFPVAAETTLGILQISFSRPTTAYMETSKRKCFGWFVDQRFMSVSPVPRTRTFTPGTIEHGCF